MLYNNVYKLYIIRFSKWFMLYMPIIGLFYSAHSLSTLQIFIIQSSYSLASALFEIPSGYLADVIGRKKTLVLGSFMGALGFALYSIQQSFIAFLIAEIIMGIGQSFISGTDSAMLYDTLEETNKTEKYIAFEGKITSLGGFAETGAALLGGIIASLSGFTQVFIIQAIVAAMAIPAALALRETNRKKLLHTGIAQIFTISYQSLFTHKKLSQSIIFSSVIGTATLTMAWTLQSFFIISDFTEIQTTTYWVTYNFIVAAVSVFAGKIVASISRKNLLYSIAVFIPLGFIIMISNYTYIIIAYLLIFHVVRGYATPILKDLIQHNAAPEIRATILSLRGLLIRLSFAIIGPIIGYTSGVYSLQMAAAGIGIIFLTIALIAAFKIVNTNTLTNNCTN